MDEEKKKLLEKLSEFGEVNLFQNIKDAFSYYFSNLDIIGLGGLLDGDRKFDGISKYEYLKLINNVFEQSKLEGIDKFNSYSGKCSGCKKGCEGYIFVDEKNKIFYNIVIEVKDSKIYDLIECYDFNTPFNINDFDQIEIKPFKLKDWDSEKPF